MAPAAVRSGATNAPRGCYFFGSSAAAEPVLLDSEGVAGDAERGQLGLFPQSALQLGEARQRGQTYDVVPQLHGVGLIGQAADHRADDRHPGRGVGSG